MGLFSRFRRARPVEQPDAPDYWRSWEVAGDMYQQVMGRSVEELWKSQPYLRMVVNFLARNVAQLGLQVFERVDENDRRRVRDGPLYDTLSTPNQAQSTYDLIYGLVADLGLYDRAYWLLAPGDRTVTPLPPSWVHPVGGGAMQPDHYRVKADASGRSVDIPADVVLSFHGWHPASLQEGLSPVAALRSTLAEQMSAAEYRRQVWQRGGRVGAVLSRPSGAPAWSDAAREQFKKDWESKFSGSGGQAGGTPLLEDGMTLNRVDFSAHEMQFVEGAKLALATVAQVFHVNPAMVGENESATYSSMREFRKMLYGETLGPMLTYIESRLNRFLVPMLDRREGCYVEFNVAEKMRGSIDEQAQAIQSAVGRPWMSADEGRALFNLPAAGGTASELVIPANVLFGQQASPNDTGSQNVGRGNDERGEDYTSDGQQERSLPQRTKARSSRSDSQHERTEKALADFFAEQREKVLPALTTKDEAWFDRGKWNNRLRTILKDLGMTVSAESARELLRQAGRDEDHYSTEQTEDFLHQVARRQAEQTNKVTEQQLEDALASDEPDEAARNVFDKATSSRAKEAAVTAVTTWVAFGAGEMGKQERARTGEEPTKTWITTSGNPRESHAALNGETVGIDEQFSNGASWPGDAQVLDVDDLAGCECEVEVTFP